MTRTLPRAAWRRVLTLTALSAAAAFGAMSFGPASAQAADGEWPRWRGPNFDDKSPEKDLLKQWPKDGPKLAWTASGLGGGFSSISIAGGKIFTLGEDEQAAYVRALDLNGSKILWSTKLGKAGGGGGYPGPRCTPTVDGEHLYVVGQYGDVACLQAATGAEVWHKNLNKDFAGKMHSGWGNAESPLVDGDRVILTPGGDKGTLIALNKLTGELIWRTADWTDSAAYTGAIIATIGGKKQYVQRSDQSVAGVDPDSGKILWKASAPGKTAVIPTPVVVDDSVFVTCGYGVGCWLFKITNAGGEFKAEKVYGDNKNMINHHGGVVEVDGKIYGYSDGKGWSCIDLKTGETAWKTKEELGKGTCSLADGMLYLREEDQNKGRIALIEVSAQGYKEHGRFSLPSLSGKQQWPHLVIAGGILYVRDQDKLYAYEVKAK